MSKLTLPKITDEANRQLITWTRSHKVEHRLRLRAQLILDWIEGLTYTASGAKNGVSDATIAKWRRRFSAHGLPGLRDAPRPGQPVRYSEADRNRVIHLACQRTDSGTPRYSQHEIADRCGMSQSRVSDILRAANLKPHKTQYWRAEESGSSLRAEDDRYRRVIFGSS